MKSIRVCAAFLIYFFTAMLFARESIVGIGVSLGPDRETGELKILSVIPGGPAERAGVKAGMLLRKIDNAEITGKKLVDVIALVRGPAGSKIKLEVFEPESKAAKSIEVAREEIVLAAPTRAKRGDDAAPLKIKDWIKGQAVDVRDGKNIYVVEFWATWCPPCRVSIPHLTELQKRFKDKGVVVVGISDEPAATVKPFVTRMGEKMNYIVACDDNRQTFAKYMEAFGHDGIPTAFIVDKQGKVVWDGHPMGGLDKAIEAVLAGNKPVK